MFEIPAFDAMFAMALVQIIWIDILLSGDNAVVIALACRALPDRQRMLGIVLGVAGAVILRILFASAIAWLIGIPFLKLIGGVALIYIATKLLAEADEGEPVTRMASTLWGAVGLIVAADATMSLDNVVAIAAASRGHAVLFVFGLLLSMPLMIVGASLISAMMRRFPLVIVAGGALLGWIAGGMVATDPYVAWKAGTWGLDLRFVEAVLGLVCVVGVCSVGLLWRERMREG